jgi:hypothetical protein
MGYGNTMILDDLLAMNESPSELLAPKGGELPKDKSLSAFYRLRIESIIDRCTCMSMSYIISAS